MPPLPEQWDALQQFFQLAAFQDKLKSAENILCQMQDVYTGCPKIRGTT
jgi:hypothetical protein